MIVRVEGADTGYKGLTEFKVGQTIVDISLRTSLLPEAIDTDVFVPYRLRLPKGEFWFVDVDAEVRESSLLLGGISRKGTAHVPKQTFVIDNFMAKRELPVFLRYQGIPYSGALRFEFAEKGVVGASEDVKFVRQFKWPLR